MHICKNEQEMAELAGEISQNFKPGDVVCLYGDLGAGKSTLAREILRAFGHKGDVPSPTFTLVQEYATSFGPIAHFDLYRLEQPDEIFELGWDDYLGRALLLIEWPDRLGPYKPEKRIDIHIDFASQKGRTIKMDKHNG